jgi:hypothetical protein
MMKSVDDCAVSCTKDVENEDNTPDSKENNGKDEESKFSENFFIICDNKTNLFEMQLNARNLNFNNWDSLHQDITSSDYTNEVFAPPDFV